MSKKITSLLFLAGLLVNGGASAQFVVVGGASSGSGSGSSGGVVRSTSQTDQTVTTLPSERRSCETEKRVGFRMLRSLMVSPTDYAISMVDGASKKLKVQIPAYYGDCLNLRFEYKISDNDIKVYAHNDKSYSEYTSCLKERGILSEDGKEFNGDKATITEASYEFIDLPEFDETKNIEAFFMSPNPNPNNGNYGPAFTSGWLSSSDTCSKRESLQEGGVIVYMSPENEAADRALRACNSLDYEAILRELERLDSSTLGNASILRNVLQGALDTARKQRATEIYTRLGEIESEFKASEDDIAAGRPVGVGEDEAIRLSNEYAKLLGELNEVVLDPSIEEIDSLVKEHGQTASRARQTEIQSRLKSLNETVAEYSKRGSRGLRDLYKGLQEYALADQAEQIEGFRLKSEAFGRVYVGRNDGRRGEQLSVERANKYVADKIDVFMNQVVQDWDDSYRVRNLDRAPLTSSQRRVGQAYDRLQRNWSRYQEGEQSQMRKYCGANFIGQVSNPVRCQQFQRGAEARRARAMRQRERDLRTLRTRGEHFSSLSNQYGMAMERYESERMSRDYDDMGIYSNYMDDYSYLYGDNYSNDYGMYDMGSMNMNMGGNLQSMRRPASGNMMGNPMMMQGGGQMMSPMMGQNPFGMNQQQLMVPQQSYMMPQAYMNPMMMNNGYMQMQ